MLFVDMLEIDIRTILQLAIIFQFSQELPHGHIVELFCRDGVCSRLCRIDFIEFFLLDRVPAQV